MGLGWAVGCGLSLRRSFTTAKRTLNAIFSGKARMAEIESAASWPRPSFMLAACDIPRTPRLHTFWPQSRAPKSFFALPARTSCFRAWLRRRFGSEKTKLAIGRSNLKRSPMMGPRTTFPAELGFEASTTVFTGVNTLASASTEEAYAPMLLISTLNDPARKSGRTVPFRPNFEMVKPTPKMLPS